LNYGKGVKKIVKSEFNLCCKRNGPRIYDNPIFPAYVPEKNKILTPWIDEYYDRVRVR